MLVDTGGIPRFGRAKKSNLDIGESVVSPYLFSRGIRKLDAVVLTHAHGVRAMNVTAWLRQQGFEKAQSMAGGIDAWSRRVDPKVPVY